ncbi:MAG: DEAD/DEAH box helicase, partial [Planctomycetaceae bacterium]
IPEIASYRVVAEPDQTVVGTLDEDFASESTAGEIFLLGNTSWRIVHVRGNDVTVVDAGGAPPSIPFWRGEAPGRTLELSQEVSRLREELEQRVDQPEAASLWLQHETGVAAVATDQVVLYARAQKAAIGLLPSHKRIVFERFFDESGGMQLVIHAPFGTRIAKAWGLAMRKRFCRSFDFELQATADDDGLILSLGPQHSFPLESMFRMLNSRNVDKLLEQALLYVPTFPTRWRWNVTRALLVSRFRNGRKVPPALQRFRADDLLTAVFPKLTGCQENITGDHVLPDHPLVRQAMHDSLQEAHDLEGLREVLGQIDRGEIELLARDTREPSPFCYELLNANPYAFLDGGEVAERRTRAVATRRSLTVESVSDLGRLDPLAIERVGAEAQPQVRSADELHDLLLSRVMVPATGELGPCRLPGDWLPLFEELVRAGRATRYERLESGVCWVATERLPVVRGAFPGGTPRPDVRIPDGIALECDPLEARVAMVRGLLEVCGPATAGEVATYLALPESATLASLEALEGEGVVLRGRFRPRPPRAAEPDHRETNPAQTDGSRSPGSEVGGTPQGNAEPAGSAQSDPNPARASHADADRCDAGHSDAGHCDADHCGDGHHEPVPRVETPPDIEWCHRRLLSRIHRLTMEGLRRQIEPVPVEVFVRFLTRHQGLWRGTHRQGPAGVFEALSQLQGLDLPAVAWERDLFPPRVENYRPEWLDELCLAGEAGWGRLHPPKRTGEGVRPIASITRVVPLSLFLRDDLAWLQPEPPQGEPAGLSLPAKEIWELLQAQGPSFAGDLLVETRMLPTQLTDVLGELAAAGAVTADGFAGLRALVNPAPAGRESPAASAGVTRRRAPLAGAGRWSLWRQRGAGSAGTPAAVATEPATPAAKGSGGAKGAGGARGT